MKIWRDIEKFEGSNPVITIGIFDGVHQGHKHLLRQLKGKAEELNGESVVVSLWPHPREVIGSETGTLKYLNSLDEKALLLSNEGIDHLIIIPFTPEFASLDSCSFVKEYLVRKKVQPASKKTRRNQHWRKDEMVEMWVLRGKEKV